MDNYLSIYASKNSSETNFQWTNPHYQIIRLLLGHFMHEWVKMEMESWKKKDLLEENGFVLVIRKRRRVTGS